MYGSNLYPVVLQREKALGNRGRPCISDWASASIFHQGPRLCAASRGRMYGSNLYPVVLQREKALGNRGPSMYGFLTGHSRRKVHEKAET
jgi:hypothetical protein